MHTEIEQDYEMLIEAFLVEVYGLVVMEYRSDLDEAIQYFERNGIKDGYGVVDWLLFRKGIIENSRFLMREICEDQDLGDEVYEMILNSFCSIFESDGETVRDIFTGEEFSVSLQEYGLVCGRLYGAKYLPEYDVIEHLDGMQIIALVRDKEDPLLAMRQVVRASHFDVEEDPIVIERTFRFEKSPVAQLTELGLDLFADDIGNTFEVYDADECIGEVEIDENRSILVSYTTDREKAVRLDRFLYQVAEFQEEAIRGIGDLL